jgi:DNA polymerase-3 subunit delta'
MLVAQNQDQILNTILSRTQLIKIPALAYADEIKEYLIQEHNQTKGTAAEVAYLSNGNMAEALSMLLHDTKGYHNLFVQWLRIALAIRVSR